MGLITVYIHLEVVLSYNGKPFHSIVTLIVFKTLEFVKLNVEPLFVNACRK